MRTPGVSNALVLLVDAATSTGTGYDAGTGMLILTLLGQELAFNPTVGQLYTSICSGSTHPAVYIMMILSLGNFGCDISSFP